MGIVFLRPWVWLLGLAVAVPVIIHLLSRSRGREVVFPTVRFLEPSTLSAVTRRTLQDWPLLLVRIAIVLLAVAALAGPVFVTPAREVEWASRVARAVVLDDRSAPSDDELRGASPGAAFARDRARDAVRDAIRWLARQDRARKEIVVLSAFKRGAVSAEDLADVPEGVGVRLVRTSGGAGVRTREISRLEWRDGALLRITLAIDLEPNRTLVREISTRPVEGMPIRVSAPPADQADADAALRAVLRRGVRLPPAGLLQDVEVPWTGDVDALAERIEARLASSLDGWEPEVMTDAELDPLNRPILSIGDPRPEDRGDRRLLWVMVLILIAVETWVRRGPTWT